VVGDADDYAAASKSGTGTGIRQALICARWASANNKESLPVEALILNGSAGDSSLASALHDLIALELRGIGYHVESVILHETPIASCTGCFGCWTQTPGICLTDDAGREIAKRAIESDLLVFLTPVTFGGYSSELKKAVDRFIPIVLPFFETVGGEIHHKARYARYPALWGVGVLLRPDEDSGRIFKALVGRNATNFHSPAHAATVVADGENTETIREQITTAVTALGARE
jgi:hypothetical protein